MARKSRNHQGAHSRVAPGDMKENWQTTTPTVASSNSSASPQRRKKSLNYFDRRKQTQFEKTSARVAAKIVHNADKQDGRNQQMFARRRVPDPSSSAMLTGILEDGEGEALGPFTAEQLASIRKLNNHGGKTVNSGTRGILHQAEVSNEVPAQDLFGQGKLLNSVDTRVEDNLLKVAAKQATGPGAAIVPALVNSAAADDSTVSANSFQDDKFSNRSISVPPNVFDDSPIPLCSHDSSKIQLQEHTSTDKDDIIEARPRWTDVLSSPLVSPNDHESAQPTAAEEAALVVGPAQTADHARITSADAADGVRKPKFQQKHLPTTETTEKENTGVHRRSYQAPINLKRKRTVFANLEAAYFKRQAIESTATQEANSPLNMPRSEDDGPHEYLSLPGSYPIVNKNDSDMNELIPVICGGAASGCVWLLDHGVDGVKWVVARAPIAEAKLKKCTQAIGDFVRDVHQALLPVRRFSGYCYTSIKTKARYVRGHLRKPTKPVPTVRMPHELDASGYAPIAPPTTPFTWPAQPSHPHEVHRGILKEDHDHLQESVAPSARSQKCASRQAWGQAREGNFMDIDEASVGLSPMVVDWSSPTHFMFPNPFSASADLPADNSHRTTAELSSRSNKSFHVLSHIIGKSNTVDRRLHKNHKKHKKSWRDRAIGWFTPSSIRRQAKEDRSFDTQQVAPQEDVTLRIAGSEAVMVDSITTECEAGNVQDAQANVAAAHNDGYRDIDVERGHFEEDAIGECRADETDVDGEESEEEDRNEHVAEGQEHDGYSSDEDGGVDISSEGGESDEEGGAMIGSEGDESDEEGGVEISSEGDESDDDGGVEIGGEADESDGGEKPEAGQGEAPAEESDYEPFG